MTKGKYKQFSHRLIDAMKANGHGASRSPNGICMKTLAEFADASEQICRRYIRGDALPEYDRIINIASNLKTSPAWLLFGENGTSQFNQIDNDVLSYIISRSHALYHDTSAETDDYSQFVMRLVREVQKINGDRETLLHVVNLALDSISSFQELCDRKQSVHHEKEYA